MKPPAWKSAPQVPAGKRLLSFASLMDKLGLGRTTLKQLMKKPDFPRPVRPMGPQGDPRWKEDQVDAWVDSLAPAEAPSKAGSANDAGRGAK